MEENYFREQIIGVVKEVLSLQRGILDILIIIF